MSLTTAVNASTTNSAFFFLLTITSGELPPLRVVNNLEDVVSRGETFMAYPFALVLGSDAPDTQPSVQLTIDAVDQQVIEYIRNLETPPEILLELVLSTSLNTVDKSIDFLRLSNVTYDAFTITGTLLPVDFLSQQAVGFNYTGAEFPGLVWGL